MEGAPLENDPAARLQAPEAYLPSLATWRYQDSPPTPATLDEVLVREVSRGPSGDAGQPRQADGRHRRRELAHPARAAGPGRDLAPHAQGAPRPPGLDTQARLGRAAPAGHPDDAGPGRASARQTRGGTGVGGSVRAEQR